jgi:hypothetical protein
MRNHCVVASVAGHSVETPQGDEEKDILTRFRALKKAAGLDRPASPPVAPPPPAGSVRIYSSVLGEEVWLVTDEEAAASLDAAGETQPVFLLDEVLRFEGMLKEDLSAIARLKKVTPGDALPNKPDVAAATAAPPPLQHEAPCRVCGRLAWWLSTHDNVVCGRCHPPPEGGGLVKGWLGINAAPGGEQDA